jgi:hypothetical protein
MIKIEIDNPHGLRLQSIADTLRCNEDVRLFPYELAPVIDGEANTLHAKKSDKRILGYFMQPEADTIRMTVEQLREDIAVHVVSILFTLDSREMEKNPLKVLLPKNRTPFMAALRASGKGQDMFNKEMTNRVTRMLGM